ncbi:hypothetical protein KKC59_02795, partial [bacterium]|nr:hypothetical protein [bacterium]
HNFILFHHKWHFRGTKDEGRRTKDDFLFTPFRPSYFVLRTSSFVLRPSYFGKPTASSTSP